MSRSAIATRGVSHAGGVWCTSRKATAPIRSSPALTLAMDGPPALTRLTLTCNQGSETGLYDLVTGFEQGVFAANPATRRMRGTNENTNGLLRPVPTQGHRPTRRPSDDLGVVEDKLDRRYERHRALPTELYAMGS